MDAVKPRKPLVEETYAILLDAICTGALSPGERLNQDEIAARLNVSRQPVNSAISILKANNFVEDTGRRGVVVSAINVEQFSSIYTFRSVIEPFAITLAGARLAEDAASQAEVILARGNQACEDQDARALLQADVDFHEMIYRWSGNHVIEDSMRLNWAHIRRSMAELLKDPTAAIPTWADHSRIIETLLNGEVEKSAAEMKAHIERAYQKTMPVLQSGVRDPLPAG